MTHPYERIFLSKELISLNPHAPTLTSEMTLHRFRPLVYKRTFARLSMCYYSRLKELLNLLVHIFTGTELLYLTSGDTVFQALMSFFIFSLGLPSLGSERKLVGSLPFFHVKAQDPGPAFQNIGLKILQGSECPLWQHTH